jgi:hypothetical protein
MTWRWVCAASRGTSHIRADEPLQDTAYAWRGGSESHSFVGVISDGAGSARFGKYGSLLACRIFLSEVRAFLNKSSQLPSEDDLLLAIDKVRDGIFFVAERRGFQMRDFACTLVAVVANLESVWTVHVGDGAILGRHCDGVLETLSAPDHGEYASTTYFITDSGREGVRTRIKHHAHAYDSLMLMSDGLERLALSMADNAPFEPFFNGITMPLKNSSASGFDKPLSRQLIKFLETERVTSRTDDDKSLVVAHRI